MTLLHRSLPSAALLAALLAGCAERSTAPGLLAPVPAHRAVDASAPTLVLNEVMADPAAVGDDVGEWVELYNFGSAAIALQNWSIQSGSDAAHVVATAVSVPAGGRIVLGRNASRSKNGGVTVAYAYGTGITLANASDWVAIRDASGVTVDSVAWTGTTAGAAWGLKNAGIDNTAVGGTNWQLQTSVFGKGDKGTPTLQNDGYVAPVAPAVATVRVSPDSASVAAGASTTFTAQATDASGAAVSTTYAWSTSDAAVATVSASGVATGVAPGTVLVRATAANGVVDDALLVVTASAPPAGNAGELVVRVLDIGQGDATLIENGTSRVLIDGGPGEARMGILLDSLGLNGKTIDLVILSHEHLDHYSGLRELFRTSRNITVRYFMENQNASTAVSLAQLRDSVGARVGRGQLIYRDSDDPCGNGSAVCTFTLNGGAKVHVLRPNPAGTTANNRSTPVKLVGPDSASFSMWFAGDAEHEAISWFLGASGYLSNPGMNVDVLKADHHGSCNGVTSSYVDALSPAWVTASVSATNTYGHMHSQTKQLLQSMGRPWYRTDENGTITFRSPGTAGGGFTAAVLRGTASMAGRGDGTSAQSSCNPLP